MVTFEWAHSGALTSKWPQSVSMSFNQLLGGLGVGGGAGAGGVGGGEGVGAGTVTFQLIFPVSVLVSYVTQVPLLKLR